MSGYIEYTSESPLSPEYPHPVSIQSVSYPSASAAIDAGVEPLEAVLALVLSSRARYLPYTSYTFTGRYSDELNSAIKMVLVPKVEPVDTSKYQYMMGKVNIQLPVVRIRRPVYLTLEMKDSVYRQHQPLDVYEVYDVAIINDYPLYIGSSGAFFLLDTPDRDIRELHSLLPT